MRRPKKIPSNVLFLFNGRDLGNWTARNGNSASWIIEEGILIVRPESGDIVTREKLADHFLHLEFRCPEMAGASGQDKGNSGVFLQGRYEVQILDSYGVKIPGKGDCGAIYDQHAPLVNACKTPMTWQSFDVIFRGARLNATGRVLEPARVTLFQNDIVIHNNVALPSVTKSALDEEMGEAGPLMLQDHGDPVAYRNIWAVSLPSKGSDVYGPL